MAWMMKFKLIALLYFIGFTLNAAPSAPNTPRTTATYTSVTVTWDFFGNAQFFLVQQKLNGVWQSDKYIAQKSYSLNSVPVGSTHSFRVKACDQTGCSGYSAESNSVTATAQPPAYDVSATAGTGGSISPASRTLYAGFQGSFTITPSSGYRIQSVTGCSGTLSGNTYTTAAITGACAVSASFELIPHILTATAGSGGSISPASSSVLPGSRGTFTVTPSNGYRTKSVTGCSGTLSGNTYTTGTITAACSVSASFELVPYTITAVAGAGGSISPASSSILYGSNGSFTVTPGTGYRIKAVTGCSGTLSGNTYTTGTITAACSVSVSFELIPYTITAVAGTGGIISPASSSILYGSNGAFTVTPSNGYRTKSVTGCSGTLSGNTYTTGTITAACSVSASFELVPYTITAVAGAGGSISPASSSILYGSKGTFTVTPTTGYLIKSVTGCSGTLAGNTYTTATIDAACSVSATFEPIPYVITAVADIGGSINPASTSVTPGGKGSFAVMPNTGYSIKSVTGCSGTLTGNTYTTAAVTAACSVSATFELATYLIKASAGPGGSISPANSSVLYGNTGSFTVTPESGYRIANVAGCSGNLSGTVYTTGVVTGPCSVSAIFEAITPSGNDLLSMYKVYSDSSGGLYLEAPKTFVLIAAEVNIPLFVRKKYGFLKLTLTNGIWSVEALTETQWLALSLVAGHPLVSSIQNYPGASVLLTLIDQNVPALMLWGFDSSPVLSFVNLDGSAYELDITYSYDALGRLINTTNSLGREKSYEYDAAGNRKSVTKENN